MKRNLLRALFCISPLLLLHLAPIITSGTASAQETYKGLDPCGYLEPVELVPLNQRLKTLDVKRVYFVGAQSQSLAKLVSETFQRHVPGAKVTYLEILSPHVEQPEIWKEVREKADTAVVGVGTCGGMSPKMAMWTADLEKAGIPSVYIVYEQFEETAKRAGTKKGTPFLRGVQVKQGAKDITNANAIMDPLVAALTKPLNEDEKKTGTYTPPKPPRIAITGTMDKLEEYYNSFYRSDGLPVVVPTEERVAKMLAGTSHAPDEVVGNLWPEGQMFTVEKVAINSVMAGCKPEYMPVLLAMAEAFGKEPGFRATVTSSTSFANMALVSGPVAKEIEMNASLYAMGPGNMANATIGRALRLFIINIGGGIPGVNLMSEQGNPMMYSWCFAEDNENSPWPPYHTTMGFKAGDSCVTVFAGGWVWLTSWGISDLKGLCQQLKLIPKPTSVGVIMSAEKAKYYAKKGLSTREAVQKYLWENTTQTYEEWSDTL